MDFRNSLVLRSIAIFLLSGALVSVTARFLYHQSPLWAGMALGTGLSVITTLILLPWKKKALTRKAAPHELPDLAKIALWGSALRFCCVALIAVWGLKTSLTLGLSGILSFGLVFLTATSFEIVTLFKTNGRAHGPA